ncbi:isoprenylcysteine carboxylmethyltransferase family protein [Exiguobacterium sp. Helios]|uniref:methyltransferase family protein n=1 Tax=Exiguobacterium sp. Helios TaxID=2735868 RepID=UPI00103F17F4|nr:isoprenylcysteine carboxylmethyltransferase family protein [Exiguobacterium sp. Helios]QNR20160.1 isoprenylcysteine carboxylmethyltransferase family protein [Exiguobacterium sp. Helios]
MTILDKVFIAGSLLWLLELFLFRNRKKEPSPLEERRSFYWILATLVATILFSILFSGSNSFSFYREIGLLLLSAGVALRYWGIYHLKHQFTRHVAVNPGDQLVSTGPYRSLRHPLYTGLFFITLGFPLYFGNLLVTLCAGVLMFLTLLHRIRIEERMLTEGFGPAYTAWARRRKRLIPFIY